MKKATLLILALLFAFSLTACAGGEAPAEKTEAPLPHISISELKALENGEEALLNAVVTGKMGDKLYIADSSGAYELTELSFYLFLRCGIGQEWEFSVTGTENGATASDAKLISDNNKLPEAAVMTELGKLGEQLYKKVSIEAVTVVMTEGNIFDSETDARILVSDGKSEASLLLSKKLPKDDRKAIADALSFPVAGDVLTVTGAFVTNAESPLIELGSKDQISVKAVRDGKINVESLEKDIAEISIDVGEKLAYKPKTVPADANNLDYIVRSVSDTSIAYIDEDGAICGKAYGKTYIHIEQIGKNKIVIPIYVEPKLELGYDKWSPSKIDETPRVVRSFDELREQLFQAALGGYREIYIDFELAEPIREADIDRLFDAKYLGEFALKTIIGGDAVNVFKDELVKFTFTGWEGEKMYGPYVAPTEQSGVNFTDAAAVLRQKYVIENSPYKRSDKFEDFPIVKNNIGSIAVYNPSQLVWALEYNLLPTFPLENSKAEYIYEQAKAVLRSIITDDMTEVQKCKAIFDHICQNAVYAVDYYLQGSGDYNAPEQSVIGFFERGRVVCEGYAETFCLLAGIEGIEVHRIRGDFLANKLGGHMWNAAVIDGKWYEICATQSDNTMRGWPDNWFDDEAEGRGHDTHSYRHFL
ncbi:MAG: hypothetical protein IJF74_05495, partial [Clostridia bacterium]|nr:hypothetical protein [Clostridia bacterium]